MKLAGVLAIGLWFLWGPRMLVNYQANSAILCFLVYFQGERIEKGQGTWERRKEPRRNVTSPSGLFLFLFIAFLQETNNLWKKQKLFKKWNTEDHRKCDGRTLAALWLILLLHCVFSRYGWIEIKTIGEIWHYLHGIFALFIVFFFFLDYKKGKKWKKTKEQRLFIPTTLVKYHATRTDRRQQKKKNVMLEAASDYIFIFWKEKKNTTISLGKKEQNLENVNQKKGLISVTICMQSIWNLHESLFLQMLSVHSKGSLHMNVDGVRAKMLGLKYQCLTFVFMGVRGLLMTTWGTEAKPSGLPVSCALFSTFLWVLFLMSFLLAWLCVSRVCWIESGYSACVSAKRSCMLT